MKNWTQEFFTSKRLKAFLWNAAMVAVASGLSAAASSLAGLELSETVTVILGLVLTQASKAASNAAKAS